MAALNFDGQPLPQTTESSETLLQRIAVQLITNNSLAPSSHMAAITPSNTVDLASPTQKIIVGVAGDVKVDTVGGQTGVTIPLQAGTFALRVTRVYATGTTATGLVALW